MSNPTTPDDVIVVDLAASQGVEEPTPEATDEPQTYSADYVAKLRQEAAESRVKAKRADDLARQVVRATAKADGRLIDVEDLAFDATFITEEGTVDLDRVTAAIDSLVERKPHLASRRPTTPIPQGARQESEQVSLLALLNGR